MILVARFGVKSVHMNRAKHVLLREHDRLKNRPWRSIAQELWRSRGLRGPSSKKTVSP